MPLEKRNKQKITFLITTILAITACQISPPQLITTDSTPQDEQVSPTVAFLLFTPTALQITQGSTNISENQTQVDKEKEVNSETGQTPTPISTPTPTPTPRTILVYEQPQSPVYLVNFLYPELGCRWSGVAGQIFNSRGEPVNGLIVEINGELEGNPFLGLGLTGTSLLIGPGGYEIQLSDKPLNSNRSLFLLIFDPHGNQLNEALPLVTYNDCQKNLIIINFILLNQPLQEKTYFPIISR